MLTRLFALFFFATAAAALSAQDSPAAVVEHVFDAMRRADTTGLSRYFHPEVTLTSIVVSTEGNSVGKGDVGRWFAGMAGANVGDWDERVPYVEVRQDGPLATAWVPYVFYYQGEVHHCGTNAFQLVREDDAQPWRILHITDTRKDRPGDCAPLPENTDPTTDIDSLASRWHLAAAHADSATFFGLLADDAYYLGTDKTEHWGKADFLGFAAPYFARGKAWAFTATGRHVFYQPDRQIAWWDEVLDTWMGPCRGTGIVERQADGEWKIRHYTLSMLVPNDEVQDVIKVISGK